MENLDMSDRACFKLDATDDHRAFKSDDPHLLLLSFSLGLVDRHYHSSSEAFKYKNFKIYICHLRLDISRHTASCAAFHRILRAS